MRRLAVLAAIILRVMPRLHTLQNLKRFMSITHSGIFNPRQLHHRSRVNIVNIHLIHSDIQRASRIERKDHVTNLLGAVLPPRGSTGQQPVAP